MVHALKLNGALVLQQGALTNVREHGLGRNAFFQAAAPRREKPVNSVKAAGTFVRYLLLIQCRYIEYYKMIITGIYKNDNKFVISS